MTRMYYKPDGYKSVRKQNRWYLSILIVLIPLVVFCASFNMVTRVSDVYRMQLNANAKVVAEDETSKIKTLETENIFLDEDVFAGEIAAYINGSADSIDVADKESELYDYYSAMASQVTDSDYAALDALSKADLILLILGIISFIGSAVLSIMLVTEGYEGKSILRDKIKKGIPVLAVLEGLLFAYAGIEQVRVFVNSSIMGLSNVKKGLLIKLLGNAIYMRMAVCILLVSIIVGLVVFYVLWITTKPRDTFNERRYFR